MKICQLKADASEKDRDFRAKQLSQQKAHGDLVEQLQVGELLCFKLTCHPNIVSDLLSTGLH